MAKAAEWSKRVAEWRRSGLTAREFCETRQYGSKQLLWWSSQLRRRRAEEIAAGKEVTLARVVRSNTRKSVQPGSAVIVVELAGARVQVPAGADGTTLARVFEALRVGVKELRDDSQWS